MTELPAEPGWWRHIGHGWELVPDDDADAEIEAGGGWDLVHVERAADGETTLW